MKIEKKIEFLTNAFENLQSLVSLADSKASTSLNLQIFFLGIVLGSSLIGDVFGKIGKISSTCLLVSFNVLFFTFILSSIVGIVLCLAILKARFPSEESEISRDGVLYFNHIVRYSSSDAYVDKIEKLSDRQLMEELAKQVFNISDIVSKKMRYMNATVVFLIINLFLLISLSIFATACIK